MYEWPRPNEIPGIVGIPHYSAVYYQPIYKNAHSTFMQMFEAPAILPFIGYAKGMSHNTFTILRHPIERWVSAMNMYLSSDWRVPSKIPMKPDAHMMPQILWLETIGHNIENLRYYKMKDGFLKLLLKNEGLTRYLIHKNDHKNKGYRRVDIPSLSWNGETITTTHTAYKFLKSMSREPEIHFLYDTIDETMKCLKEIYAEDIKFYESRNFINE